MIEYYQMEQLIAIAQEGTLSKAAQRLLISQPALTRSIQHLEEDLGVVLFERKKNKMTLNETGKLAVKMMEKLVHDRDQMIRALQLFEQSKFLISIGSCAPAPIWGLRHIFQETAHEMKIKDTLDSNEENLIQGLNNYEYSLIVLNHPLDKESYESIPLFEENLYLSVPPAHPLAMFKEISFDDLNGQSVLLLSRIGFWNEICVKKIPQSHLLIQEDVQVFQELTRASALPNFKSSITLQTDLENENRINIPLIDPEAHAVYYGIYHKKDAYLFASLSEHFRQLDWQKVIQTT